MWEHCHLFISSCEYRIYLRHLMKCLQIPRWVFIAEQQYYSTLPLLLRKEKLYRTCHLGQVITYSMVLPFMPNWVARMPHFHLVVLMNKYACLTCFYFVLLLPLDMFFLVLSLANTVYIIK